MFTFPLICVQRHEWSMLRLFMNVARYSVRSRGEPKRVEGTIRGWQFDPCGDAGYQRGAHGICNVAQYLRPLVSRHHVRREPRARARLRGRRLPAGHCAHRSRHPALARPAPPRPVALHHAAARAGHGENPLRHLPGRERPSRHHRHADRAADRKCRCAIKGLLGDQGHVPPEPCRLHLRRKIRRARLSRRRAAIGARDRGAGRCRRDRAKDSSRHRRCAAR